MVFYCSIYYFILVFYWSICQSWWLSGIAHCLSSLWPRFSSQPRRSISRDFSLADHTLPTCPEPAWQKTAQSPLNDTTQPVDSEEEDQCPTMDRPWLKERIVVFKGVICLVESPSLGQTPTSQCMYATAMLSPVEIKSNMSHVTLTPSTLSALHASNEKIWRDRSRGSASRC